MKSTAIVAGSGPEETSQNPSFVVRGSERSVVLTAANLSGGFPARLLVKVERNAASECQALKGGARLDYWAPAPSWSAEKGSATGVALPVNCKGGAVQCALMYSEESRVINSWACREKSRNSWASSSASRNSLDILTSIL